MEFKEREKKIKRRKKNFSNINSITAEKVVLQANMEFMGMVSYSELNTGGKFGEVAIPFRIKLKISRGEGGDLKIELMQSNFPTKATLWRKKRQIVISRVVKKCNNKITIIMFLLPHTCGI